jgi:hypothetical protein
MPARAPALHAPPSSIDQRLYHEDVHARDIIQAFVTVSSLSLPVGILAAIVIQRTGMPLPALIGWLIVGSGGILWYSYLQIVRGKPFLLADRWLWRLTLLYNLVLLGAFTGIVAHQTTTSCLWGLLLWPGLAVVFARRMLHNHHRAQNTSGQAGAA